MTDGPQPLPVRRAIVTINGAALTHNRSTITDEAGRFSFTNLPAGGFTLTASKPSYVTNAYGARRPGRPGTPLVIAAGQRLDVRLILPRGAVIAGTVRDESGEPAANTQVIAMPAADITSAPQVASANIVFATDDRGAYRIYGLAPGDYVVSATTRPVGAGNLGVMSAAQIDAAFAELRARPNGAPQAPPPNVPLRKDPALFPAPIFFPSTPAAYEAAKITLAAGEERSGIDIQLRLVRTAAIEGIVTSPDGAIPSVAVTIDQEGPARSLSIGTIVGLSAPVRVGADGKFKFTGLVPGRYHIAARSTVAPAPPQPPGGGTRTVTMPVAPAPTGTPMWAAADVTVTGENVEGLVLALQPAMKLTGRVAFDAVSTPVPTSFSNARLSLVQRGAANTSMVLNGVPMGGSVSAPVKADATFEVLNILPGTYRTTLPMTGWWLRSVVVNGVDALDTGLEFANHDIADAVVTLTDRHNELSGTLQTAAGSPATDYVVVVFPADRALWRPQSRRVQSTRPATDGKFTLKDLPGGEYLIAALSDFEPTDADDPRFLEQLVAAAVKVTIADGERKTQDLRIR